MKCISIIIPIYNAEQYIERCAKSLFEQTLKSIEYIFVDDCSTDASLSILEETLERYPSRKKDAKIIRRNRNGGQAAARNTGLDNCTGKYIIHCDADDWVDRDYYEKLYGKAEKDNSDIIIGDLIYEKEGEQEYYHFKEIEKPEEIVGLREKKYYMPCHLVRASIIEDNGFRFFENVNMWEDTGMLLRVYSKSRSISYVRDSFYHYNVLNCSSISSSIEIESRMQQQARCTDCLIEYFRNGGPYLDYVIQIRKNLFYSCVQHSLPLSITKNLFPEFIHKYIWTRKCPYDMKSKIKAQLYLWNYSAKRWFQQR